MKKLILFLLLLGITSTRPFSISLSDTAYWIGTIAFIHWANKRITRMEMIQEAQVRAHNNSLEGNNPQAITIPPRPTITDSLQELYTGGREVVHTAAHTATGLRAIASAPKVTLDNQLSTAE